jgi:hypothetical protein
MKHISMYLPNIVLRREPMQENPSVLQEAEQSINGQRAAEYGSASENFSDISIMWSAHLSIRNGHTVSVLPEDVAYMMIMLKICREKNSDKRDSLVDIAGYAGCIEKIRAGQ